MNDGDEDKKCNSCKATKKKKEFYVYPERLTRRPQCITCFKHTSQRNRKSKRKTGGESSTQAGGRVDFLSLSVLSGIHPRTRIVTALPKP